MSESAGTVQFSPAAVRRLQDAFQALFTPTVTVVVHVKGGEDLTTTLESELTTGLWRTPAFELKIPRHRRRGKATGLTVHTEDGVAVAHLVCERPVPLSESVLELDPLELHLELNMPPPFSRSR
jgi:hypothetical protein